MHDAPWANALVTTLRWVSTCKLDYLYLTTEVLLVWLQSAVFAQDGYSIKLVLVHTKLASLVVY